MATEQIGVKVEPEMKEAIEDQLEYGDTMSEWVREAIRQRLEQESDTWNGKHEARS
jgi:Arc/MetJ-type ribon-helix-helix transcriptional regulator